MKVGATLTETRNAIPFLPEFEERMLSGQKTATTRTHQYGSVGDLFSAFGRTFQLTKVDKVYLGDVCSVFYKQEGFDSQSEFHECWNRIHPRKKYHFCAIVWLHQFKRASKRFPRSSEREGENDGLWI